MVDESLRSTHQSNDAFIPVRIVWELFMKQRQINYVPGSEGILSDLFPGIELPVEDYGVLYHAIEFVLMEWNFQTVAAQISKVIQLYETMIVRWGVMLVGPTGGGKSVILKSLDRALT
ncbi:hypothetical protein WA026_022188 [Henosepilachna vigintioctopunctata]|uniref:Dynein heavy chain hydrolytic ATP-binding dynein motor region domain-containing protein n=1 Tax=Henosepilachna vigintioctopunctata TaxID=420089 RepID=A0AAW1URG4_9CUCU